MFELPPFLKFEHLRPRRVVTRGSGGDALVDGGQVRELRFEHGADGGAQRAFDVVAGPGRDDEELLVSVADRHIEGDAAGGTECAST